MHVSFVLFHHRCFASGFNCSEVADADVPGSSSIAVLPPLSAKSLDSVHLKGSLKISAHHPPQESRGNVAPTVMEDQGWIKISIHDLSAAQDCPLNKVRTMPGLVVLCGRMHLVMLQRSFLVDRIGLYTGESL